MMVTNVVTKLLPLQEVQPSNRKINLTLHMKKNRVNPSSFLHTCFIYKNGDALLDTGAISWKSDQLCLDFQVDATHHDISEISMVLVSPSCGEWVVPSVVLKDEDGNVCEFVATNVEGNSMFMIPEPPSEEKIQEGMREYSDLKKQIMKWHISMVGVSTLGVHVADPSDMYTKWFALGGLIGFFYQYLIQLEIDQIGNEHKGIAYQLLANSFFRFIMISSAFMVITPTTSPMNAPTFATILAGFIMNKVAMYMTFWTQKFESPLKD